MNNPSMSPEEKEECLRLCAALSSAVTDFYYVLFRLGTGGRFHAFVEWCGVMQEHVKITTDLLNADVDAFNMNVHSGQTLPVPSYRLAYLAEKMECIFNGAVRVAVAENEPLQLPRLRPPQEKQPC